MSCQLAPLALVRACYHSQSDQLHAQCGLADSFNAAEAVGTGSATLAELPPPHWRRSFRQAGEGSVRLAAPPLPPRSVLQGHRILGFRTNMRSVCAGNFFLRAECPSRLPYLGNSVAATEFPSEFPSVATEFPVTPVLTKQLVIW